MRTHSLRNSLQIAVIGGNGFLGRSIIKRLSPYPNLRIFSLDKQLHNVYIDTSKSKAIIEQIQMDVGNEGAVQAWLMARPVDIIIYAAGFEGLSKEITSSSGDEAKSLVGLDYTLSGLKNMNLDPEEEKPYFLYISSWAVYGSGKGPFSETSKTIPTNYSGLIKLAGEDLVKQKCAKSNATWCILRPTEIYGKKHYRELANKRYWSGYFYHFLDRILLREVDISVISENSYIDLLDINYFTKFVELCLVQKLTGIYNLSSETPIKLKDMVSTIYNTYADSTYKPNVSLHKENFINSMNLSSKKAHSLLPYDVEKYSFNSFLQKYIPLRRYELAKSMAVEDALSEPVLLDMTSAKAKEVYEARKIRRKLAYQKIKEIAGPEFFSINVGNIPERYKELESLEITDKLLQQAEEEQKKNIRRLELLKE